MAKIRQPMTAGYALQRAMAEVPMPLLAEAVGKKDGVIYKWSDPMAPHEISVRDALLVDGIVYDRAGYAPFQELFAANVQQRPRAQADIRDCTLSLQSAVGALAEAVLISTAKESAGGRDITQTERQKLLVTLESLHRGLHDIEGVILASAKGGV